MAEQIFPTKGNLIACKKNLELAKLGFDLLDRKRNVLMREMMKLIDVAAGMQKEIGDTFQRAYRALPERPTSRWASTNLWTASCRKNAAFPCMATALWG